MFTVLFLILTAPAPSRASEPIPNQITIKIAGEEITGYRGSSDDLKEEANREIQADRGANQEGALPAQGFVFEQNEGSLESIKVSAWSQKGNTKEILKVAEETLLRMAQGKQTNENAPVGFRYSNRDASLLGKEQVLGLKHRAKTAPLVAVLPKTIDLSTMKSGIEPVTLSSSMKETSPKAFGETLLDLILILLFLVLGLSYWVRRTMRLRR